MQVTLNFRGFSQTLLSPSKIPEIVAQIQKFYITNFPGMAVSFLADSGDAIINTGPCGGFTKTYRCLSDYLSAPVREGILCSFIKYEAFFYLFFFFFVYCLYYIYVILLITIIFILLY